MRSLLQTNIISIKGVAGKAVVKITATAFATFDLSSDKNHPGQMQCNAAFPRFKLFSFINMNK